MPGSQEDLGGRGHPDPAVDPDASRGAHGAAAGAAADGRRCWDFFQGTWDVLEETDGNYVFLLFGWENSMYHDDPDMS